MAFLGRNNNSKVGILTIPKKKCMYQISLSAAHIMNTFTSDGVIYLEFSKSEIIKPNC